MTESHQRLHAIVQGRVQGVSFRYYTHITAANMGLTGWVRNLPDRAVEVVAEGTRPALERLLTWLHQGPTSARVTHISHTWQDATGEFPDFAIR